MSAQSPTTVSPVVYAFITLQLIGGLGLLVVVLTALCNKKVRRLGTWYSFCISWILSALSYTLLVFAGQQYREPSKPLCMIQAAAIYAAPTLTSCTTLSLLIHVLLVLRFFRSYAKSEAETSTKVVMIVAPYTFWLVIFIGVILFSLANPKIVSMDPIKTYCISTDTVWYQMSFTVVLIISIIIVLLLMYLGFFIYKNADVRMDDTGLFATAARMIIFGAICFLMLAIALAYSTQSEHQGAFDIILSTMPILALLTFGSQKDLLDTWTFCKGRHRYSKI